MCLGYPDPSRMSRGRKMDKDLESRSLNGGSPKVPFSSMGSQIRGSTCGLGRAVPDLIEPQGFRV